MHLGKLADIGRPIVGSIQTRHTDTDTHVNTICGLPGPKNSSKAIQGAGLGYRDRTHQLLTVNRKHLLRATHQVNLTAPHTANALQSKHLEKAEGKTRKAQDLTLTRGHLDGQELEHLPLHSLAWHGPWREQELESSERKKTGRDRDRWRKRRREGQRDRDRRQRTGNLQDLEGSVLLENCKF